MQHVLAIGFWVAAIAMEQARLVSVSSALENKLTRSQKGRTLFAPTIASHRLFAFVSGVEFDRRDKCRGRRFRGYGRPMGVP